MERQASPLSAPAEIDINAYAILRDVDVLVADGTHVELRGGVLRGDLTNNAVAVPEERRRQVVRIHGHCLLGDVNVTTAEGRH